MKKYYKEYHFKCDVYTTYITLIATNNSDHVLHKHDIKFNGLGTTYYQFNPFEIFVILDIKHEEFDAEVIAHEATHVAGAIFDKIGAKHDTINEEPYSYLVGWVVFQICKKLKLELKSK
jgi:hypothetical protein